MKIHLGTKMTTVALVADNEAEGDLLLNFGFMALQGIKVLEIAIPKPDSDLLTVLWFETEGRLDTVYPSDEQLKDIVNKGILTEQATAEITFASEEEFQNTMEELVRKPRKSWIITLVKGKHHILRFKNKETPD